MSPCVVSSGFSCGSSVVGASVGCSVGASVGSFAACLVTDIVYFFVAPDSAVTVIVIVFFPSFNRLTFPLFIFNPFPTVIFNVDF